MDDGREVRPYAGRFVLPKRPVRFEASFRLSHFICSKSLSSFQHFWVFGVQALKSTVLDTVILFNMDTQSDNECVST